MPATRQDIPVMQGDYEPFVILIFKPDGVTPAVAGDVTGATASWRWGPGTKQDKLIIPGTTIGTKVTGGAGSGALTIGPYVQDGITYQAVSGALSEAETAALTYPGRYFYECKIVLSGHTTTITTGELVLSLQIKP